MLKRIAYIGISLIIASGCAATMENSGTDIKAEPSRAIKAGTTTRDEVIKTFGEPSTSLTIHGSEELVYESRKTETPTYLGGFLINEAGREVTLKKLKVVIRDGIVQSYKYEVNGE